MKLLIKEAVEDYKQRTGKEMNLNTLAMHVYKGRMASKATKQQRLSHLSNARTQYIATLEEVMRMCIKLEIDYNTFITKFVKANNNNGDNQSKKLRRKKADGKVHDIQSRN